MRECREIFVEGAGAEDAGHHPIYVHGEPFILHTHVFDILSSFSNLVR